MKDIITETQAAFEADVLKALFSGFREEGVRYAVLRNYESLPESVGSRDIDIVVEPDDLYAACAVVSSIAQARDILYGNYFADERLTQFALVAPDRG